MRKSIFIKLLICSMFIVILSISLCMSSSYALGEMFSQGKGFLEAGNDISDTINTTELTNTSNYIYNALLGFAIMVAIVIAMILGIQFMIASADEKAKVKEALMPFIVGCIVVFGAFTIWKVVVNMGNDAEESIEGFEIGTNLSEEELELPNGTGSKPAEMKENAIYFIDNGGDLSTLKDEVILKWYNAINRHYYEKTGAYEEYYLKLKDEWERRK